MEELRQLVQKHLGKDPVPLNDIKRLLRNVHIDECDIDAALASVPSDPGKRVSGEEFLAWLYDAPELGSRSRGTLQPPGAFTGQALSALPAWGLRQILKSLDYLRDCGYTDVGKLQQFLDEICTSGSETLVDNGGARRALVEEAIGVMMTAGITEVTDLKEFRSSVAGAFITTITGEEPNQWNAWMSEIDLPSHYTQAGYKIEDASRRGISMAQLQSFGDFVKDVLNLKNSAGLHKVAHAGEISDDIYTWDSMDVYGCNWYFLKPLTSKRHVSFMELIARKDQAVVWYISHRWGTPISQSLRMLQLHSQARGQAEDCYWMDSFTQNQHRSNIDPLSFENSPFMKILHSEPLKGMVALLDAEGKAFRRRWTLLECFVTAENSKKYDMATWLTSAEQCVGTEYNDAQAVLLLEEATSTRITYEEASENRNLYGYSWSFPKCVVEAAVEACFKESQCSDEGDLELIGQYMKDKEARLNTSIHKRFAAKAIYHAAHDNKAEKLERLLEEHSQSDSEMIDWDLDKFGHSAAFVAASQKASEVLTLLIQRKASVNKCRQADGATPVYIAAFKGHIEALKLLVAARADVDRPTEDRVTRKANGATPVYIAAFNGHIEALKLLVAARADVDRPTEDGATPAFAAAEKNSADVLQVLIEARADVQKCNKDGHSPASVAKFRGHRNVLELLPELVAS